MQKSKTDTVAAIDVGSNSVRMMIAQVHPDGSVLPLEDLRKATQIGKDTFSYGRIQVESIHDTCEILRGFSKLMQDYKVKLYRAVCTSGIREAENREYVLEQIRIRTGLEVEVINNAQERFLMYKAMKDHLTGAQKASDKGILIVDIRSGGVEISVYDEGNLKFTEYIKVGSLRLREILADLERLTLDFPSIMEEFVESRIDFLKTLISERQIMHFIGLGGELRTITRLCADMEEEPGADHFVRKKALARLYTSVHSMTTEQIIQAYGLQKNQAEILLPSVILFNRFLKMTNAEGISAPMVSLRNGMLADIADELFDTPRKASSLNDVISSVWYIGQKYYIDRVHSQNIEKLALAVFDQTGRYHRLGEKERFYLRVAAILHDVGKYVNLNQHDIHSYNIIRFQDVMGFSDRELNLIANIARYHSEELPQLSHDNYRVLSSRDQIIVSKLAVMLKLAEAMDISHKQKITDIELAASGEELIFKVRADEDILLEEWSFEPHVTFFEEVMGIKPVLKRRG